MLMLTTLDRSPSVSAGTLGQPGGQSRQPGSMADSTPGFEIPNGPDADTNRELRFSRDSSRRGAASFAAVGSWTGLDGCSLAGAAGGGCDCRDSVDVLLR